MYDFVRTDEPTIASTSSTQMVVDGVNFDKAFRGFRTLAVIGRETIGRNINAHNRENYSMITNPVFDGAILLGGNIPPRTIKVTYQISLDRYDERAELYEFLNYHLHRPQVRLHFTDDPKFYYTATLQGMGDIPVALEHTGELEFVAHDPYKYSVEPEVLTIKKSGTLKKRVLWPIAIEDMTITAEAATEKLIIKNESNGQRIIIDHAIKQGDKVSISFKEYKILLNDLTDITGAMDIRSNYEDLEIETGDIISINIDATTEIRYRERRL